MEAADIIPYEAVSIWNVTNGNRFETYAIEGERGSGVICINGAAARMVAAKDLVIIASFVGMDDAEALVHEPMLVFVDERNRLIPTRKELPGQGTLKKVAW
jgi:aspartate 1-decarboxylase